MCIWTVQKTFVYAVEIAAEDDDGASSEASPCCRLRASSDGLTMCKSWSLASSIDSDATTAPPADDVRSATSTAACPAEVADALEAGGDRALAAMAHVRAEMASLSFDESGCRVVQRALELARTAEARAMAEALRGSVLSAARSAHAQRVLQKVIHHLGTEDAAFIAEELAPQAGAVAQSGTGFGVLVRLLEFSSQDSRTVALADQLLMEDLPGLACHKFGHRVVAALLSNGLQRQRARVMEALLQDVQRFARHRFASRVLEAALLYASAEEQAQIASALMAQPGAVVALACHAFGVHVVRAVLEVPRESKLAMHYLVKGQRRLRKDRYGLELLKELGLEAGEGSLVEVAGALGGA